MVYCVHISMEINSFLYLLIAHQWYSTARIQLLSRPLSYILNKPAVSVLKHLRHHLLEFGIPRNDRAESVGLLVNTVTYL